MLSEKKEIVLSNIIENIFNTLTEDDKLCGLLVQFNDKYWLNIINFEKTNVLQFHSHIFYEIDLKFNYYEKKDDNSIIFIKNPVLLKEKSNIELVECTTQKVFFNIKNNYILINQEKFNDLILNKKNIYKDVENIFNNSDIKFSLKIENILDKYLTDIKSNLNNLENVRFIINIDDNKILNNMDLFHYLEKEDTFNFKDFILTKNDDKYTLTKQL